MTHLASCMAVLFLLLTAAVPARAQSPDEAADARPAFSLSSSQAFTTRESPSFFLTFRRVTQLDFRVYKVRDPFAFFAALDDPHQSGTGESYAVPQERSWIERLTDWKRRQRSSMRGIARAQLSRNFRAERRAADDRAQTTQRVQLNVSTFAQVPLLNPDQLVTSWRELLPNYRDPEFRRVPLDVSEPGLYLVEAVHERLRAYTLVMVSDVGLVSKASPGQVMLFAADRFTGEPAANCDVQLLSGATVVARGETADDGVFANELADDTNQVVGLARCGEHVAATDPGSWTFSPPTRELLGYVYTDKPIYRPGQSVHVKAILRWRERDTLAPFGRSGAELVASDANDKVLFRQTIRTDTFGSIKASFPVPATAALGTYTLRVNSGDAQATAAFEVQEYRKPEFEVEVTPTERFVSQGREAVVTIRARYYFGQPVANGRLEWTVNEQPYYSPFRYTDNIDGEGRTYWYGGTQTRRGEARLDTNGQTELRIPLAPNERAQDYSARIEARVTDASSREVSGNTIVHATWGTFLVSTSLDRYVFRGGDTVRAGVRAANYVGAPQTGVSVRMVLQKLDYPDGRYNEPRATDVATTTAVTGDDGHAFADVALPREASGSYRITVTAMAGNREVTDQTWLWVPGREDATDEEGDRYLELISDRSSYQPGDTAQLAVRGETLDGPVFVTKEGQHVSWYRIARPTPDAPLQVPIDDSDVGDIYVNLLYLRDGRMFRAERRLSVPATQRTLQVSITAEREVSKPGEPGAFTLRVADDEGRPVRAQLSLAVIDEAVFAVRADDTTDPTRFFYRREYSRVGTSFSREYYFTGYSGTERLQLTSRKRRPFTLADFKGDRPQQPEVRKDFPDAIYWMPDIVTNADGEARVAVTYPDALTTWRLTARAVTEDTRVGTTVARTTTTKDLIVRVITPRFLTEGDEVVMPTIVHNYRDATRTASVDVQVSGLDMQDSASASVDQVTLASGAEQRHDWRFVAPTPGAASITASARTESDRDAVELPVPVVPFGLSREQGASGAVRGAGEASAEVTIPATANAAGRTVRVALAPSMAGSLLGALDFLTSYPYGCTEQTLSSFLPNLLVTRALTELKLAPTERLSALDRQVSSGLRRLGDLQHNDGGWGWWKSDGNHPFMTAYAVWGLDEARRAGLRVETYRISNGARSLARAYATYPRAEPDLKAYMAYVMRRSMPDEERIVSYGADGEVTYVHAQALEELWSARSRMSAFGRALLLMLLDERQDARANQLASTLLDEAETRGDLSWWSGQRDDLLFDAVDTSVEATAFAVQALVRRDAGNPLLERAVRWLLVNRSGGYWGSTKRTAMAVYGLLDYMRARGEGAAGYDVEVRVNGQAAGRHTFTAAQMTAPDPVTFEVPAQEGVNRVEIVKPGAAGTVYWSATASWFDPSAAEGRSGSRQLAIARRYALLTPVTVGSRIVYRETPFSGTAAPGDVLTVRLTVAGSPDWRYLAIEDPLPAGVEAVQDTTAYPLERPASVNWWWGSHVEYRDTKTVFFQESFEQGRYEYVYLVKVTSAGRFRAVPAQVQPMYVPDVSASSEPATLVVTLPQGGTP